MGDFSPADAAGAGGAARPWHRAIVTVCLMIATLMQSLDTTVANVALPYMQGTLSASVDQISWVLTSYVVASAIFTAPVGWVAARFGAKNLLLTCVAGFTVTSILCGLSSSMSAIVAARFLQGMFGAALIPITQSTLLDIYPPERRGATMSLWSMGVMTAPVLGPTLGGFLTSHYDWRYVFFINVPFGIVAALGLLFYMPRTDQGSGMRFDWTGFSILSLGLASMQIGLDRGEELDWFSSPFIVTALVLAALCFYLFAVHMMTAKDPFIPRSIFRDLNFNGSLVTMFTIGMTLLASLALLPQFLENLSNYPVETTGLVMAPRGLGSMAGMFLAGRLTNKVDARLMMLLGYALLGGSLYMQVGWTPDVSPFYIGSTITVQGIAVGLIFTPLQVIAFATLAPAMRTQGAALLSLLRNIGMAVGVSVANFLLDRQTHYEHAELAQFVTPFARPMQVGGSVSRMLDPNSPQGASVLNGFIDRQSQIIGYMDDYKMMLVMLAPALLCMFFLRSPAASPSAPGGALSRS